MAPIREPMLEEKIIAGISDATAQISYYVRQLWKFLPHFWAVHNRARRANKRMLEQARKKRLQTERKFQPRAYDTEYIGLY